MDCPPGFTLKRKRTEKNSGTSTSNMAEGQALPGVGEGHLDKGFHLKIKAGGTELRGTYPVAPPNVVPPIIRNVTRKDLAVPAVHSMLYGSGSRNMPHCDVKKEVPAASDQSESSGKKSPSAAVRPPANPSLLSVNETLAFVSTTTALGFRVVSAFRRRRRRFELQEGGCTMDIISQLQEQTNKIAAITFNTFGTLQRDSPAVKLSPDYPEPPANPTEDAANFAEQPKLMSEALVQAAKQFDALVTALPLVDGGEEVQLKRIAELQAENDAVGQELQRQLEAAEEELKQVRELFSQATDNCLNLKKPD